MKKKKIVMLSCGGTIEKTYDEQEGSLANRDSVIRERFLSKMRLPYLEIEVKSIMSIDSLYMTDEHRKKLAAFIELEKEKKCPIIVVHGTDTMEKSLQYVYENVKDITNPVVFTGAMKPLEWEESDARQNIIEALTAAQILAPGIYLSFHGKIFYANNARKNYDLRTFEEKS